MKISLEMITERLKCKNCGIDLSGSSGEMCLERAEFYREGAELQSDILYISLGADLPESLRYVPGCALLSIGAAPERVREQGHLVGQFAELAPETDIFSLSNEINGIFRMFDRWERQMEGLHASGPLQEVFQDLLEITDPVLENGLSLMNSSFHLLAMTRTNRKFGGYQSITDHYNPEAVSPDIMSMLRTNAAYHSMSECREITIMDDEVLPFRTMNKNIYVDGAFAYRIAVTECIRPFRSSDETLVRILEEKFLELLEEMAEVQGQEHSPLAGLLSDMIRKDIVNKAALDMELGSLGWQSSDQYCVLCLKFDPGFRSDNTGAYYCRELRKEFPESLAFVPENDLVMVVNQTVSQRSSSDFFQQFAVFIRENNFRAGTSNPCRDLYKIRKYYRQAQIVLDIGQKENPSEWRHSFGDYVLNYIFSMATSEFEKEELYSPVYYKIRKYDEENGTSLLETLRCYLDNQMNTLRTAQELFIHRSTMIYRLKRICEIGQTTLADKDELLHLHLTFHLLEQV